jgi:hypothetical protein
MKRIIVIFSTVIAFLLLVIGYFYLGREPAPEPPRPGHPENVGEQNEAIHQELRNKLTHALLRGRLDDERDKAIKRLEKRLKALELSNDKAKEPDEPNNDYSKKKNKKNLSGTELGGWMSQVIKKEWDRQLTGQVTDQIEKILESSLPDVRAEQVACGNRFCQATFVNDEGGSVSVRNIMGTPPFMFEVFTVPNPDGRLEVYFTREGVSLPELRKEASLAWISTAESGVPRK